MAATVKWGILSTADINRRLLPGADASPKAEVVAVASRDAARAEDYARKWNIGRAYGSYDELLADPDVEAIYNPLPNTMHTEWSIKALDAGKHVLCEKPISRHTADVEAAFDAAERNDRLLSEAFMYRHNPQTARLTQLIAEGAIGELRLVRSAFSYSLYDAENIRLRTDVEGGALMDVGCYCVSGSRLLAGEPESVSARRVVRRDGDRLGVHRDDALSGRRPRGLRLRDGDGGAGRTGGDRQRGLALPRRSVALPQAGDRASPRGRDGADRAGAGGLVPPRGRGSERRDQGRRNAAPGREDAVAQARALEALHESATTGRPVSL